LVSFGILTRSLSSDFSSTVTRFALLVFSHDLTRLDGLVSLSFMTRLLDLVFSLDLTRYKIDGFLAFIGSLSLSGLLNKNDSLHAIGFLK